MVIDWPTYPTPWIPCGKECAWIADVYHAIGPNSFNLCDAMIRDLMLHG